MSLRDELKFYLEQEGVDYDSLRINKDDDFKGRVSTSVHFIINGDSGPVFYDTSFADDLKLNDEHAARLVAKNARLAYNNHTKELE